ncbi:MAG: undecaprenyl-phosphate glucose phosphotransferase [Acidobacteriota bacterium]
MSRQRRNDFLIPLLTVLADIAAIESAFLLAYWIRFYSRLTSVFEVTLGIPDISAYIISSLVIMPVWLFVFQSRRLYGTRRNTHISDEMFAVIRVVTICMLITMSASFFYRGFSYSRGVFILLWLCAIVTVTFGRYLVMEFEKYLYRRGRELKSVAIVGSQTTASLLSSKLGADRSLGYEVLGYYAEAPAGKDSAIASLPFLGGIGNLRRDIPQKRLQAVLIALPYDEHSQLLELMKNVEGMNIDLMLVPDVLEMMTSRIRIKEIGGVPLITLKDVPLSTWNRITKRAFDILVASTVLLLTLPVTLLIAALVKLTSRGPVFYIQERVGLDGVSFPILKFRSMRTDAEAATGPVRNTKNDNRASSIGKILRRTSLDELPQLLNVLAGQMSIVGPRPERPYFVQQFKNEIPRYLERHRMKTGMTGWAQVNGLRGNAPIDERTKYDIYYIENWSLVFDIKIILKTIHAVIFGEDAY